MGDLIDALNPILQSTLNVLLLVQQVDAGYDLQP